MQRFSGKGRLRDVLPSCHLHLSAHGECFVLGVLHDFAFAGTFVVDSHKVENAVDEYPVELFIGVFLQSFGIGGYGVEADVDIAR